MLGFEVFYRGEYVEELSRIPYERFLENNRFFRKFLDLRIRRECAKKVARKFSLTPDLLLTRGRQYIIRSFQGDFYYALLALNAGDREKTAIAFPVCKRLRKEMENFLDMNSANMWAGMASAIGSLSERLRLLLATMAQAVGAILVLTYWRLSKPCNEILEIRDTILWFAAGPGEISFDPEKLSLPLYLKELFDFGKSKVKFSVICPFLKNGQGWDAYHSRSIPLPRLLRPGLSGRLFHTGLKDLFRLLLCLPSAFLGRAEKLEFLSVLPHFFLKRVWLSSVPVRGVVESNSAAGWDHALVYAAREMKIPVLMVFYSANNIPKAITDETFRDAALIEFQEMLAEHFCVWTEAMKNGLAKLGYNPSKIHVTGPQMFAPIRLENRSDRTSLDVAEISVIEVSPLNKLELVKRGFGKGFYYSEYCVLFLIEAIETIHRCFGKSSLVLVKMKRNADFSVFDSQWSKERKTYLKKMGSRVLEMQPDTNPWVLIDRSDIVISIPFSSISEAASTKGKPAAFFDPLGIFLPRFQGDLPLLSNKEELYDWLKGVSESRRNGCCTQRRPADFGPKMVAPVLASILSDPSTGTE